VEGSNLLPELLPSGQSADAPSSLMEKVIPLASMGINVILSLLIERQVKARVKSKLPGVPKVGYGIYCDNSGAITYMKAPWTQDNPDIGVTSATGSIDVDAGKSIVIWADEELRAGATDHVTIHAGRDAGTVDISGDKVNITSSGRGVNIKTGMEGVKIVTELGKIDIKSEFGPIHLSRESSEGQSYGSVNIDGGGVQAKSPNGRITLKSGETSMDISSTGFVKVTATHGLTIMVGDSKVEVELAGITITSPYDVKINDLTIAKTSMSYKGTTANIANVLKIK
jgi:hypothetical protein